MHEAHTVVYTGRMPFLETAWLGTSSAGRCHGSDIHGKREKDIIITLSVLLFSVGAK